jgi:hypothetical protein
MGVGVMRAKSAGGARVLMVGVADPALAPGVEVVAAVPSSMVLPFDFDGDGYADLAALPSVVALLAGSVAWAIILIAPLMATHSSHQPMLGERGSGCVRGDRSGLWSRVAVGFVGNLGGWWIPCRGVKGEAG